MSEVTTTLSLQRSSFINRNHPDTAYPTSSGTNYHLSSDEYMLFGFAGLSSSLKRNKLVGCRFRIYDRKGESMSMYILNANWTAGGVTWNTKPGDSYITGATGSGHVADYPLPWEDRWVPETGKCSAYDTRKMLQGYGLRISAFASDNFPQCDTYLRTVLSGGSAPYIEVTYDNAVIIKPKPNLKTKLSSTIDPAKAQTLTWELKKDGSDYCLDETWTQASAKIYWRVSGGSWNQISVSGSTMSGTIPAYTLPTGSTIEYYVAVTDTDGNTTSSTTYTTSTPSTQITQQNCPTSGYKNPRNAIPFSWYFKYTYGNYTQGSAVLHWKKSTDVSYTDISASGSTQSLTVPANTFPANATIQWYLSGTDSSGKSSQTPVYSFSTVAATAYATLQHPVGTVEDGSKPITVRWTLTSADGLQMSRVFLWWKLPTEASNEWHSIIDTTDIITSYTIPANFFAAGETQLLVGAYNIDGVRGPDSISSFIVVAAPDPPSGLAATPVPRTTISWQSEGQEAYEIMVDGKIVQKAFGPAVYSWTHNQPLEDGEHIIRVRIQGIYGLWSTWSETSIFVQNDPPWNLTLTGKLITDAKLTLNLNGGTVAPLHVHWYRDGKRIAWTTGTLTFTDRFALGEHEYYAELWHYNGNYARSNTVKGTMKVRDVLISLVSGGEWMHIGNSENSMDEQSFSWSKSAATLHVTASAYPVLEMSPYEDESISYNCAFTCKADAKKFEQFKGKIVVVKSRRGNVVVGGLTQLIKRETTFYTNYRFTIQRIHWEDFIRDDQTN